MAKLGMAKLGIVQRSILMRRWSTVLLFLALLLTLFAVRSNPATAASFITRVSQVPTTPTSAQTVRVWIQSDTVSGESVRLEYHHTDTNDYTKVNATFDTSGPSPANWRADIPALPNGTFVEYQL